jgi:hypothetical protein
LADSWRCEIFKKQYKHGTADRYSLSAYYWLIPGGVKFSKSSRHGVLLIDIRRQLEPLLNRSLLQNVKIVEDLPLIIGNHGCLCC